ncbi:MAG: PQQ-dependent sugar dehydrogenase, partial [Bacteroidota bacterium]
VVLLDSLKHPWSMAFLSETDVLITEKDGHLIRADLATGHKRIVKGFPNDLVDSIRVTDFRDNSGIFEVLKHPNFEANQWIYVSYAAENAQGTTTKIIRAKLEVDTLLDIQEIFLAKPYRFDLFHYGGGMVFGADQKLYFTIGERYYNERDQPALPVAQDLKDKRGKIHRLNDDGSIPTDNPDFGPEALPSIFAAGIRAAQGITLDKASGQIWFSEHGSLQGDELNLLVAGGNYGWPIKTSGKYRNRDFEPPSMEGIEFKDPKYTWLQTIAPTGLVFYYGKEFPNWKGDIILSGLSRGSLWRIRLEGEEVVSLEELFVNDRIRFRKVALSPQGQLFMLSDEVNGRLIRIQKASTKKVYDG